MKRRILFALFGIAILLIGMGMTVVAPTVESDKPNRSTRFRMEIDGLPADRVVSVEGLGANIEAVEYRTGEDNTVEAVPGAGRANNVGITGILTDDRSITEWVKAVYSGEDLRKDITVELYDQKGSTLRTFNLIDCFPIHFEVLNVDSGPGASVMRWHLEVRVNRIEMA